MRGAGNEEHVPGSRLTAVTLRLPPAMDGRRPMPMRGPKEDGLVVVIAQPLDVETAQRLRWQAEHERERGSATCRAVVAVVS